MIGLLDIIVWLLRVYIFCAVVTGVYFLGKSVGEGVDHRFWASLMAAAFWPVVAAIAIRDFVIWAKSLADRPTFRAAVKLILERWRR
ncbi:MAG: hypothetical protein AAF494_01730 [Pseudomonadota bacterium]